MSVQFLAFNPIPLFAQHAVSKDIIMTQLLSISAAAFRVMIVATLMVGPVYGYSIIKAGEMDRGASGAGLVLVVNLQRMS